MVEWQTPNYRSKNGLIKLKSRSNESNWLSLRWHNGWSKLKRALGLTMPKESNESFEEKPKIQGLSWTCHICGKTRPDDKISVHSRVTKRYRVEITENIRYCNDNPDCIEAAKTKTLLPDEAA